MKIIIESDVPITNISISYDGSNTPTAKINSTPYVEDDSFDDHKLANNYQPSSTKRGNTSPVVRKAVTNPLDQEDDEFEDINTEDVNDRTPKVDSDFTSGNY